MKQLEGDLLPMKLDIHPTCVSHISTYIYICTPYTDDNPGSNSGKWSLSGGDHTNIDSEYAKKFASA